MNHENINNTPHSTDSKHSALDILTTVIFYLAILFFIIGFNFSDRMVGNWYQQFMPNIGGRTITDVFFLDSLTGWAVTNATNQASDTTYVLKTTNSGDGWIIQHSRLQTGGGFSGYFKVYFLDQNTGYTCDVKGIYKSTDGGMNWESLNAPLTAYTDMSVLNEDTIWLVTPDSFGGGVFRTSNGGASWQNQINLGSTNPNHIYMYNARIGFIAEDNFYLRKTTDSGVSWNVIPGAGGFSDMYFRDSLTGWKTSFQKTTNGGINWIVQPVPQGGNIVISQIRSFDNVVNDTIWGVGSTMITGSGNRGMICRSTNSGDNWQFQVPDSNISIFQYQHIQFAKPLNGWAYTGVTGVHTTAGGDPIWFTPVTQISSEVPKEYKLFNNYPNPFNPSTNIKYQISDSKNVTIKVFDVTGKEITTLVNAKQNSGTYETTFNGSNYSSGVYFYSLIIEGSVVDTKRMLMLK